MYPQQFRYILTILRFTKKLIMNRRNFIRNGSLAGITFGLAGVNDASAKTYISEKTADDFVLNEATIAGLQQRMETGQLSSKAITAYYLKRIKAIDKAGPKLNAVIEINPAALTIADEMDRERKTGKMRGPLHGIPVLIKDNIDTGDGMMTTAGSIAMLGNRAKADAFIVKKLREAGAVLLGKTNLSEWANFRSTKSTSGWSSRGGQTKNPYLLGRNPSGSSSGSGAAVAANLCAVAIGTETDGSIVSPASVNGIVGIKPTVGLLSRTGIIPISATQDTAGPMARTVKDAAILLGALTGVDNADAVTNESNGKTVKDYTVFLDTNGLSGKRLGIEKAALKGNTAVVALFEKAVALLKEKGATIVEIELSKTINENGGAEYDVLLYEFKDGLNKYLASANGKVKSLEELIAFNKATPAAMPFFKQEILELSQAKEGLDSQGYKEALVKSTTARKLIDAILKDNNLDAIVATTNGPAVCIDLVNGDYDNGFSCSSPAAMAGYPHITVPMGLVHELPVGISFFGTAYSEPALLAMAYAYEQASLARALPKFINSGNQL
jgi:amidase